MLLVLLGQEGENISIPAAELKDKFEQLIGGCTTLIALLTNHMFALNGLCGKQPTQGGKNKVNKTKKPSK
jgi:hypothetical protein